MFAHTVKTVAIAAVVVFATAGASFAAQYAWVDQGTNVKKLHKNVSQTVNHVSAGEKVKIIGSWNNWYKIQIPGPDGWVRKHTVSLNNWNNNPWPNNGGNGGQICFNGQYGSVCLSN